MKKIIALAATLAASAVMSFAVTPILLPHVYGGTTMLGSSFATELNSNQKMTIPSNLIAGAGVGVNIPFGGMYGIQPEVNWVWNNIGYHSTTEGGAFGTTIKTDTDNVSTWQSIDIPVLLTLKYNKINIGVGPYISIPVTPMSSTTKGQRVTTSGSSTTTTDIDTKGSDVKLSSPTFGIEFAAGYEERIGLGRGIVAARYMLDFTPTKSVTTASDGTVTKTDLFTRRALMLDVGYKLPLKF